MLRQANSTFITLIPKVSSLQTLNEYWPISYGNVIYKIISKILSSGLRGILNHILSHNQSAFILSRRIADNILLAHELVRGYHREKDSYYDIKVYFQKAYDYFSWDFLKRY